MTAEHTIVYIHYIYLVSSIQAHCSVSIYSNKAAEVQKRRFRPIIILSKATRTVLYLGHTYTSLSFFFLLFQINPITDSLNSRLEGFSWLPNCKINRQDLCNSILFRDV